MSRFDYVKYDDTACAQQAEAKVICQRLETFIVENGVGRAQSLALTKLEESYMWIGKFIRDQQLVRNIETPLQEERKNL